MVYNFVNNYLMKKNFETLKFYQFLYFYMELFNTDPDPTHYFGMNPW